MKSSTFAPVKMRTARQGADLKLSSSSSLLIALSLCARQAIAALCLCSLLVCSLAAPFGPGSGMLPTGALPYMLCKKGKASCSTCRDLSPRALVSKQPSDAAPAAKVCSFQHSKSTSICHLCTARAPECDCTLSQHKSAVQATSCPTTAQTMTSRSSTHRPPT